MEAYSALRLFEKEGLLTLSDSFDEPSRVWIKAPREDLYRFQVAFPQFDTFIKYMLRNMPGVLSDFVKFSEEAAAQKTGLTVEQVVAQLKKMEAYNFLSYDPRKDKPQLQLMTELLDTRYFVLSKENYQDRKNDAMERVKAVIEFVNNDQECRSIQLLRYFNEKSDKACGRCDVCLNHAEHTVDAGGFEQISRQLMTALREHPMTLSEALQACSGFDEEEAMEAIRWMIDNGKLALEGEFLSVK